jgi:hypothetical protein
MSGPLRSPASRYNRLAEDALADAKLLGPFAAISQRVIEADRVRLRALVYVRELTEAQVRQAAFRVAENRCLVAWVRQESYDRFEAYRYSLEHLMIEAPQSEAVTAERALTALDRHGRILNRLDVPPFAFAACVGEPGGPPPAALPGGAVVAKG